MTAAVFVAPDDGWAPGARILLAGPEGRHAARVRRVQPGEHVDLVDGLGSRARCVVATVAGEQVGCEVLEVSREPEPAPEIVVVQALPKGERGELAVELLTEVGVDRIVPWQAARCVAQWKGERGQKSLERWRSTAREAGKQSRRSRFPVVEALASTGQVAALVRQAALRGVLSEESSQPLSSVAVPAAGQAVLVVGPEGGLAPQELEAFAAAGATAYRLGASVLRTSSAGMAAAAALLSRTSRWQ